MLNKDDGVTGPLLLLEGKHSDSSLTFSHGAQLLPWKWVMPGLLFVKGPESEV